MPISVKNKIIFFEAEMKHLQNLSIPCLFIELDSIEFGNMEMKDQLIGAFFFCVVLE